MHCISKQQLRVKWNWTKANCWVLIHVYGPRVAPKGPGPLETENAKENNYTGVTTT